MSESEKPAGKEYKDTLNLPKTDFPMRAGLPQREPEILARCRQDQVDAALLVPT